MAKITKRMVTSPVRTHNCPGFLGSQEIGSLDKILLMTLTKIAQAIIATIK